MTRDAAPVDLSTENSGPPTIAADCPLDKKSWEILSESTDIFFKALRLGRVRGIVSIMGLPASGSGDCADYMQVVQDLIDCDILVTVFRNGTEDSDEARTMESHSFKSTGVGLGEFCDFIWIQPVIYVDNDADKADILDFYGELAQRAAVEATDLPTAAITLSRQRDEAGSPGTLFTMEDDPSRTVDLIDELIHNKRIALQWHDRRGGRFSPFS